MPETREARLRAQNVPAMAPNVVSIVRKAMHEHPEIDTMDEHERGRVIDYAAREANGGGDTPWGRKSRQRPNADGFAVNPNGDGMCYLRPDGMFEIVDVISGADGSATWDHAGVFAQGENGYWAKPGEVGQVVPPQAHRYRGGGNDSGDCDECGQSRFADVHRTAESLQPHGYDGGEHDTGLCDVCQQARPAEIHGGGDAVPAQIVKRLGEIETVLRSMSAGQTAIASRMDAVDARLDELGSGADDGRMRAAVKDAIRSGLRVDVEVLQNGQSFLRHGHGDKTVVTFDGDVVGEAVRQAPMWEPTVDAAARTLAPTEPQDPADTERPVD